MVLKRQQPISAITPRAEKDFVIPRQSSKNASKTPHLDTTNREIDIKCQRGSRVPNSIEQSLRLVHSLRLQLGQDQNTHVSCPFTRLDIITIRICVLATSPRRATFNDKQSNRNSRNHQCPRHPRFERFLSPQPHASSVVFPIKLGTSRLLRNPKHRQSSATEVHSRTIYSAYKNRIIPPVSSDIPTIVGRGGLT